MRFKTLRTSETGLKFQALTEKIKVARDAQRAIAEELGFEQWRDTHFAIAGGLSACIFKEAPNKKIWMNVNKSKNEWLPKENIKEGKVLIKRFRDLPSVGTEELNDCIGFDGNPWQNIGFSQKNDHYFGFSLREDWNVIIPEDCEEITVSVYKELFG